MPRRDSIIWTLLFFGAVATFILAKTSLVPPPYAEKVHDVAAVAGFVAMYLKASPLGPGSPKDIQPPDAQP